MSAPHVEETLTDFLRHHKKVLKQVDKHVVVLRRTGGKPAVRLSLESEASANEARLSMLAAAVAAVLYVSTRRSRYFGNTAPLLMLLAIAPLITTQTVTAPWLWALPFLFTFLGGVFADALETHYRKLFLVLTGAILAAQALECLTALPLLAR